MSKQELSITIDGLTLALIISSAFYIWILGKVKTNFKHLNKDAISLRKLLILSCALVCIIRSVSFIGVVTLNLANVSAHYDVHGGRGDDANQAFYDSAFIVLFDLPNCIVVSTYVLFVLVWAECYLQSRYHTERTITWRRGILLTYMVFNTVLYSLQFTLYCLIFWPTKHMQKVFRSVLFLVTTCINFIIVIFIVGLFLFLGFRFSGFPFRSRASRTAFERISKVMWLWSLARIVWAVAFLVVYEKQVELLQGTSTPLWSLLLFVLYISCEIVPFYLLLEYAFNQIIAFNFETTHYFSESADYYNDYNERGRIPSPESFFVFDEQSTKDDNFRSFKTTKGFADSKESDLGSEIMYHDAVGDDQEEGYNHDEDEPLFYFPHGHGGLSKTPNT